MWINRTGSWLLAWGILLLLVSTAAAQGVPAFVPGEIQNVENFDPVFAQPDLSPYGAAMRAPSGYFGGAEALFFFASAPGRTQIGLNNATSQVYVNNSTASNTSNVGTLFTTDSNSVDNSYATATLHTGMRFELGYVDEDSEKGWLLGGFYMNSQTQTLQAQNVHMVFQQPMVANYDGWNGGVTYLPILYGFIDQTGVNGNVPDGVADDLNRNNLYGSYGRDRGVVTGNVLQTNTTLSGAPSREGQADTISSTTFSGGQAPGTVFNANGPPPGTPPGSIPGTVMNGAKQPIDYGDAVPLPVIFTNLKSSDRTFAASAEASRLWRLGNGYLGGTWDLVAGARFLSFTDEFDVYGEGGILANSYWNTSASNRVVAGQVGLRYRRQWERIVWTAEARLAPGANFQTIRQVGVIGSALTETVQNPVTSFTTVTVPVTQVSPAPTTTSQLVFVTQQPNNPGQGLAATRLNQPLNLNRTGFTSSWNTVSFAPIGELRLTANYQLFNSVALNVGWTGVFVDGIARGSDVINYSLPSMGINHGGNKELLILNGITLGVQYNR